MSARAPLSVHSRAPLLPSSRLLSPGSVFVGTGVGLEPDTGGPDPLRLRATTRVTGRHDTTTTARLLLHSRRDRNGRRRALRVNGRSRTTRGPGGPPAQGETEERHRRRDLRRPSSADPDPSRASTEAQWTRSTCFQCLRWERCTRLPSEALRIRN